jgi:hypothetical protein
MRELLARVADVTGDGDECPPTEQLVRSGRGELDPQENEEIVLHVSTCTACAAGWRIAREISSAEIDAPSAASRTVSHARTWSYLAAAAVLVMGVGLGYLLLSPDREEAPVYREQEDRLVRSTVEPESPLPRDAFLLHWTPGPEGTYYDILVSDVGLKTLAREEGLDRTEFRVPRDALAGLEPGGRVLWHVTAHLPDGREIESETFFARVE